MITSNFLAPPGVRLRDETPLKTGAFIAGEWRDDAPHGRFSIVDPATMATIAEVRLCGRTEPREAIAAGGETFPHRRRQPSLRRWLDQTEQLRA